MTGSFLESLGSVPMLYVFSNVFKADEMSEQVQFLADTYEEQQNRTFLEFWSSNGEKILSERFWIKEYKKQTSCSESDTEVLDPVKGTLSNCQNDIQSWQKFCENIYVEQYQIYIIIFYEYYKHLHKSLSDIFDDTHVYVEDDIKTSIEDDFEKLQLLGLPTAFGRGPIKNQEKNNKSLPKIYSGFFSDDESDCIIMMDAEQIKDCKDHDENDTDASFHDIKEKAIGKKRKNRKLKGVPHFILENKGMIKYWRKRFSLFSRYDDGIRLDCESWFSVTPEKIATHIAERLSCDLIIDAFCGCGGNAIQFARTCNRVIAIDIDPIKINMAKHNAKIYGVAHKIDFIIADFLQISRSGHFQSDIIFLSPPWGGPKYKRKIHYDIENYLQPSSASALMEIAKCLSKNVVFYLPRNTSISQVIKLAGKGNRCEVEHNYLDSRLVAITVLYGENILKV